MNPQQIFSKVKRGFGDAVANLNNEVNAVRAGDPVARQNMTNKMIDQYSGLMVGGVKPVAGKVVQAVGRSLNGVPVGTELGGAISSMANGTRKIEIDDINNLAPIFDKIMRDAGKRTLQKLTFGEKLKEVATQLQPSVNTKLEDIPIFLRKR